MTTATGLVITLDSELKPQSDARRGLGIAKRAQSAAWYVDKNARLETLRLPSANGDVSSFLEVLALGYNRHLSVSIAPHDLWYVVLTEIAAAVNESPDIYRSVFTREKEKILIAVLSDDPSDLPLDEVERELRQHVPVDMGLFLPEFSTHTERSRLASIAAFADMVKSYYDYATFACGLPAVEFRGSEDDWRMFVDRARDLQKVLPPLSKWLARVQARTAQIADLFRSGDQAFVKDIFTAQNIGSGSELLVNGWFAKDFYREGGGRLAKLDNFPKTWSLVPFTNLESGRRFVDLWGCFDVQDVGGFQVAGYDRITYEHTR